MISSLLNKGVQKGHGSFRCSEQWFSSCSWAGSTFLIAFLTSLPVCSYNTSYGEFLTSSVKKKKKNTETTLYQIATTELYSRLGWFCTMLIIVESVFRAVHLKFQCSYRFRGLPDWHLVTKLNNSLKLYIHTLCKIHKLY